MDADADGEVVCECFMLETTDEGAVGCGARE